MKESNNNVTTGGITAIDVLQIVFIVLKLCGVIKWSWWLVLMPIWISLGIGVILFIILLIYGIWLKKH
jgi:hypothetical protein